MAEKAKNKIIVLEPSTKLTTELLGLINEKGLAEVVSAATPEEAIQEISTSLPCMMIVGILDNNAVPSRIQLFKRLETAIKHHGLKIFAVSPLKNRQLADLATQKLGVADYVTEPVPVRTMMFKANLQLKAVDSFRKQQELKKLADEKVVIKKLEGGKKPDAPTGNELKPGQKPALQMAEDTFLFKNSGVKKTGKKYTVELEGPDPSTGEWVRHEDKGDAQSSWRWVPNDEKEKQAKGELPPDGWVHQGDKPVFNETTQKWAMSSENPSLSLKEKGKTVAEKVGTDEKGDVFVAEDSPAAEENLKKNRALVEKKKQEKAKGAAEAPGAGGGEAKSGEPGQAKKGVDKDAKDALAARLQNLIQGKDAAPDFTDNSGNELDGGASAAVLNDRRDPENQEQVKPLKEKRLKTRKPGEAPEAEVTPEEAEAEKPNSPLAFLKKKKEELGKGLTAQLGADPAPRGVNELKDDEGEEAIDLGGKKRKLKNKKPSLDGLKSRLGLDDEEEEVEEGPSLLAPEDETEEDEAPGAPRLKARKQKTGSNAADALAALREDAADPKGEFNGLKGGQKKSDRLRALKKKTFADIQARLADPLPEEVSAAEEEALREELGLKGKPEIKAKDLLRRKRLKDIKGMKDRLGLLDAEIDNAEEEEKGDVTSAHRPDDPEASRREGDLSADKLKGIGRAIDGGGEPESEEEAAARRKKEADEAAARRRAEVFGDFHYVPAEEIQPLGNAWEATGSYYVYLNSSVRYKGFGKIEDLLPLWIVEAEEVPQLLDKTNQWRFRGGKPVQAKTPGEVPSEVREFLLALRDQLTKTGKEGGEEEDSPGAANEDRTADEVARELAERKKKRHDKEEAASADRLLESLGEEAAEETAKAEAEAERKDDRLASLRAKLGLDEDSTPEEASEEPAATEAKEQKPDYADQLELKADVKSEGIQKFLEKRKKKKEKGLSLVEEGPRTLTPSEIHLAGAQAAAAAGRSVYLGVLVALADVSGPEVDPAHALGRVLTAIEAGFANCFAVCTGLPDSEGQAIVNFSSPHAPPAGKKVTIGECLAAPITARSGEAEKILGYLMVKGLEGRGAFGPSEEKTVRKTAARLAVILSRLPTRKPSESAA